MLKRITDFTYKIENQAIKTGIVYKIACEYYRSVIQNEISLANITEKDHILCIGGGICPFSAILFHQLTGAKVTVIDNNAACIPKAKEAISRLNISEKVKVFHQFGDSSELVFSDYTIVHLAVQVCPMKDVFSTVKKKISPQTKLLVRRSKKQLSSMYQQVVSDLPTGYPYAVHKSRNIGSTVMYVKQPEVGVIL